jgi:hypothetical protein
MNYPALFVTLTLTSPGVPFRVTFGERWLMFTTMENSNGDRNDSFRTDLRTF